ncbi:hypothetical protein ACFQ0Q_37315 [Streptomyces aureus]
MSWETSARADADLVLTTLEYALASREVEPGTLVHHADDELDLCAPGREAGQLTLPSVASARSRLLVRGCAAVGVSGC